MAFLTQKEIIRHEEEVGGKNKKATLRFTNRIILENLVDVCSFHILSSIKWTYFILYWE